MIIRDIAWLAGLLEGEGCFATKSKNGVTIKMEMTDRDVIHKAAKLMGAHVNDLGMRRGATKIIYRLNLYGGNAIGWMMTLYSFMGNRRKAKIRELITMWKSRKGCHRIMTSNLYVG